MKQQTFTAVRIELGTIEAISFEEAKELVDSEGFQVNYSEEKVIEYDNLVDNKFYGNLDFQTIENLRDKPKPITQSKRFTLELEHDNGKINISVYAKNYQSAIKQVINAEGCPESAILSVKQS